MLDEVVISPMLHKVTGAGHSCKLGGGGVEGPGDVGSWGGVVVSEFSGVWGKRGEGRQGREGVQLPDSLMSAWSSDDSLVLAWRQRSLLPDGSRQLLSLYVEVTCGRMRCKHHTTQ